MSANSCRIRLQPCVFFGGFISQTSITPKDVALLLSIGEATARRIMASGEIESMRAGQKLWRTTRANVAAYQKAQYALAGEGAEIRQLMQTIACLRELERLDKLQPEYVLMLQGLERQLADRRGSPARLLLAA